MNIIQTVTLKNGKEVLVGQKVNYGFYKGIFYMGMYPGGLNGVPHVALKDKNGATKAVYTDLFIKYAEVVE
jgi:hypothetical protein